MIKKQALFLIPACIILASCASNPSLSDSNGPSERSESLYNTPRVIFQNLESANGKYYYSPTKTRKVSHSTPIHTASIRPMGQLSINTPLMGDYNDSVNDRFNGVTNPIPRQFVESQPPVMANNNAARQQMPVANKNMPSNISNKIQQPNTQLSSPAPIQTSASQVSAQPGTTYVPMTFPVPPPQSMMQQFHMKLNSQSEEVNNQ